MDTPSNIITQHDDGLSVILRSHVNSHLPYTGNKRNFDEYVRNIVARKSKSCQLCRADTIPLYVVHLFAYSSIGYCFDTTLTRAFLASPDNARMMCKKCNCLFGTILKFITNKKKYPTENYKVFHCYSCKNIATNVYSIQNKTCKWNVGFCNYCFENVTSLIDYMCSKSMEFKKIISLSHP